MRELQDAIRVLEFVGNDHFWKRLVPYTLTWKHPLEGKKEGVYKGSGAVVYSIKDREKDAG